MFEGKLNLGTELVTAATWRSIAISFISVWGDETRAACSQSHFTPPVYIPGILSCSQVPTPVTPGHPLWCWIWLREAAVGEGNGNPLQCSGLENPRDGGAWWAAAYGVAQSRTQLKRLSSSSSSCGWGGDVGVNQLSRRGALFSFPRFLCCHDSWKLPSVGKYSRYFAGL